MLGGLNTFEACKPWVEVVGLSFFFPEVLPKFQTPKVQRSTTFQTPLIGLETAIRKGARAGVIGVAPPKSAASKG
jgi:hypothetical protein